MLESMMKVLIRARRTMFDAIECFDNWRWDITLGLSLSSCQLLSNTDQNCTPPTVLLFIFLVEDDEVPYQPLMINAEEYLAN